MSDEFLIPYADILADLVLIIHLAFVLFVLCGAWLTLRWAWIAWLHIPAAAWGAAIEFGGWICPLTPLENALRRAAGGAGYSGGFIDHYLLPLVYPPGLTRTVQIVLGSSVLAVNLLAYGVSYGHWTRRKRSQISIVSATRHKEPLEPSRR